MKNGPVTVYDRDGKLIRGYEDTPPQYLKGWVEWYKLKFKVTPDVLIPRPETELLVDQVLMGVEPLIQQARGSTPVILDIGTGSGCIAISIAKNAPKVKVFAIDISQEALDVASENAKKNRMDKRIFFIKSDLLTEVRPLTQQTRGQTSVTPNIIVANLPYIPTSRIGTLDPSVKDFEPHLALDGGPDGFDLYRRMFSQIREKFLSHSERSEESQANDKGLKLLVCEIDDSHDQIALQESKKYFPKAKIEVKNDLAGKTRILLIRFQSI